MSPSLTPTPMPTPTPTTTPTPRRYVLSFHIFLHHTFYFFTFPTSHPYHRIYISANDSVSLSLIDTQHVPFLFSASVTLHLTLSTMLQTLSDFYLPKFSNFTHFTFFFSLPTSHLSFSY